MTAWACWLLCSQQGKNTHLNANRTRKIQGNKPQVRCLGAPRPGGCRGWACTQLSVWLSENIDRQRLEHLAVYWLLFSNPALKKSHLRWQFSHGNRQGWVSGHSGGVCQHGVMGPSHVVPGQETSSQGHTGSQNELKARLAQHSQSCSEGAAAGLQGTCMAAPMGPISGWMPTYPPWGRSWTQARPTFVFSSVVGAFTQISFPIMHREPILQGLFGQQGASLVQFIKYLQGQRINSHQ